MNNYCLALFIHSFNKYSLSARDYAEPLGPQLLPLFSWVTHFLSNQGLAASQDYQVCLRTLEYSSLTEWSLPSDLLREAGAGPCNKNSALGPLIPLCLHSTYHSWTVYIDLLFYRLSPPPTKKVRSRSQKLCLLCSLVCLQDLEQCLTHRGHWPTCWEHCWMRMKWEATQQNDMRRAESEVRQSVSCTRIIPYRVRILSASYWS